MNNIFPGIISNDYHGKPIAKWFFVIITLVTIVPLAILKLIFSLLKPKQPESKK